MTDADTPSSSSPPPLLHTRTQTHPLYCSPTACDLAAALHSPISDTCVVDIEQWLPGLDRVDTILADPSSPLLLPALRFSCQLVELATHSRDKYPSFAHLVPLAALAGPEGELALQLLCLLTNKPGRPVLRSSRHMLLSEPLRGEFVATMKRLAGRPVDEPLTLRSLRARRVLMNCAVDATVPEAFEPAALNELARKGLATKQRDQLATEAVQLLEALAVNHLMGAERPGLDQALGLMAGARRGLVVAATRTALAELQPARDAGQAFVRAATEMESHAAAVVSLAAALAGVGPSGLMLVEAGVVRAACLVRDASPRSQMQVCRLLESAGVVASRVVARHSLEGRLFVQLAQGVVGDGSKLLSRDERALLHAALSALAVLVQGGGGGRPEPLVAAASLRPPSALNALLTVCVDNARNVGGSVFSLICMLVSDIVQVDQGCLEPLSRSDLGQAFLTRLLADLPHRLPVELEALMALPELLTTLATGQHGRSELSKHKLLECFFGVFEIFGPSLLSPATVDLLGSHVEDFLRVSPLLRRQCVADIVNTLVAGSRSDFYVQAVLGFSTHLLLARELSRVFCDLGGLGVLLRLMGSADAGVADQAKKLFNVAATHSMRDAWDFLGEAIRNSGDKDAELALAVQALADLVPKASSSHISARWEHVMTAEGLRQRLEGGLLSRALERGGALRAAVKAWLVAMSEWHAARQAADAGPEAAVRLLLADALGAALRAGDVDLAVSLVLPNRALAAALPGPQLGELALRCDEAQLAALVPALPEQAAAGCAPALLEACARALEAGAGATPALLKAAARLAALDPARHRSADAAFAVDPGVTLGLVAMQYPEAHVVAAQRAIRSNNLFEVSRWLGEHGEELADEDLAAALLLSLTPAEAAPGEEERVLAELRARLVAAGRAVALERLQLGGEWTEPALGWLLGPCCMSRAEVLAGLPALGPGMHKALAHMGAAALRAADVPQGLASAPRPDAASAAACFKLVLGLLPSPEEQDQVVDWAFAEMLSLRPGEGDELFERLCELTVPERPRRDVARAQALLAAQGAARLGAYLAAGWPSKTDAALCLQHAVYCEYVKLKTRTDEADKVPLRAMLRGLQWPLDRPSDVAQAAFARAVVEEGRVVSCEDAAVDGVEPCLHELAALLVPLADKDDAMLSVCQRLASVLPAFAKACGAGLLDSLLRRDDPTAFAGLLGVWAWLDPDGTAAALVRRVAQVGPAQLDAVCALVLSVCRGKAMLAMSGQGLEGALLDAMARVGPARVEVQCVVKLLERLFSPLVRTAVATGDALVDPDDERPSAQTPAAAAITTEDEHWHNMAMRFPFGSSALLGRRSEVSARLLSDEQALSAVTAQVLASLR